MSRELDARVAEVMGQGPEFDYWKFLDGKGENPFGFVLPANMDPTGTLKQLRENHPNMQIEAKRVTSYKKYSTDPAACEEVKKAMRSKSWRWNVDARPCAGGYMYTVEITRHNVAKCYEEVMAAIYKHINEKTPWDEYEAICLAFLAAVEAEKGAKQQ